MQAPAWLVDADAQNSKSHLQLAPSQAEPNSLASSFVLVQTEARDRLNEMCPDLVIIGVSARAAAQSALRAGLRPWCVDLFADVDLRAVARCQPTARFPDGLIEIPADFPAAPWLYTGGLENYPDLVDQLASRRLLLGNQGKVLRRIRDPIVLSETLGRHGFAAPRVQLAPPVDFTERWLKKPRRSGGGLGITVATAEDTNVAATRDYYWQQFIPGESLGALFISAGESSRLIGATEQLIGCDWAGAGGFQYVGSLGPVELLAPLRDQFERLGECLTREFSLRGVWGLDAIVRDGQVHVVEVNPRYTAAVEVLEVANDLSLIAEHCAACDGIRPVNEYPFGKHSSPRRPARVAGKAVWYARRTQSVDTQLFARLHETVSQTARFADIPAVGSVIEHGQPIATVLAEGASLEEVRARLRECLSVASIFENQKLPFPRSGERGRH